MRSLSFSRPPKRAASTTLSMSPSNAALDLANDSSAASTPSATPPSRSKSEKSSPRRLGAEDAELRNSKTSTAEAQTKAAAEAEAKAAAEYREIGKTLLPWTLQPSSSLGGGRGSYDDDDDDDHRGRHAHDSHRQIGRATSTDDVGRAREAHDVLAPRHRLCQI